MIFAAIGLAVLAALCYCLTPKEKYPVVELDGNGRPVKFAVSKGCEYCWSYDEEGRCISFMNPDGDGWVEICGERLVLRK